MFQAVTNPDAAQAGHVVMPVILAASLVNWIPVIAALAPLIWYAIQIWESKTVQKHVRLWRHKQRVKRIAKNAAKAALALSKAGPPEQILAVAQVLHDQSKAAAAVATALAPVPTYGGGSNDTQSAKPA